MTEVDAIALAQSGSNEAFNFLYREYTQRLGRWCYRFTKDPLDAEDLQQQVWLQVSRKIATFKGEASFSTWLYRIALSLFLMSVRKRRVPTVSLEDWASYTSRIRAQQLQSSRDPADTIAALRISPAPEVMLYVQQAIQKLPPRQKTIAQLCWLDGFTISDAAQEMGLTVGAVKSGMYHARANIRAALQ